MIRDNIRELLDRDPFVPFRLVLSSGKHYDVVDPHSAALLKSEVFVVLPDGERSSLIPLLHVTSVETRPDGRARRRTRRKPR
jgi:L-ascorbate metabolism protein UlaG (beta-lactamase superfamily)